MSKENKWWGDIPFAVEQIRQWCIGERKISVQRLEKEWIVWDQECPTEQKATIQLKSLKSTGSLQEVAFSRHLLSQTAAQITVQPMLADRSIVARPAARLNILPGEKTELFVSSPLWFCLITKLETIPIIDTPFFRPSDSWFGANTMQGELCYGKYTDARVNLALLEKHTHRAITKVSIINEHTEALKIDRINLPVPFLTLYHQDGGFYTQEVEITQHSDNKKTGLRLRPTTSNEKLENKTLVAKARQISDTNHFVKSIQDLLI